MSDEQIIYSDPAVTKKAKDFLKSGSESADYRKAADAAVSEVMSAVYERINRKLADENSPDEPQKEYKPLDVGKWLRRK